MKRLLLSITLLLLLSAGVYAQKDIVVNSVNSQSAAIGHNGNNEIKLNLLYMVLGMPEVSYERLIDDNMGVGISAMVSLIDDPDLRFSVIADYRLYFGNKKANGFFIEGNMGLVSQRYYSYYYNDNGYSNLDMVDKVQLGLGAACGAKFLARNGLFGEAYVGAGRLLGNDGDQYYPRVGITIGKRF
ncbi:hypothetical protein AAKU52_001213 [Pedobacter sp. CG_S7]|uniref:hypothetical protein n=1 Tax=Pedobacter sp. CG_S7 TaxID=3143930 RepID=UPI00339A9116